MAFRLIVCADDYGIAPGVGKAIRSLIEERRISATSCMTVSPHWPDEAKSLRHYSHMIDVGLHLTLTDQRALGSLSMIDSSGHLPSFGQVVRRAFAHRLSRKEVMEEFTRQLDAFVEHFGASPDFLDSHHHVHQLPVVKDLVLEIWHNHLSQQGAYVRTCTDALATICKRRVAWAKAAAISLTGRSLRAEARRRGLPLNQGFTGTYDFTKEHSYASIFPRFLIGTRDRTILMCHPGSVDEELCSADCMTKPREAEYSYLMSEEYLAVLRAAGATVSRFGSD